MAIVKARKFLAYMKAEGVDEKLQSLVPEGAVIFSKQVYGHQSTLFLREYFAIDSDGELRDITYEVAYLTRGRIDDNALCMALKHGRQQPIKRVSKILYGRKDAIVAKNVIFS